VDKSLEMSCSPALALTCSDCRKKGQRLAPWYADG
jgi:hypothetical protein